MKKRFTKYPKSYVRADSDSWHVADYDSNGKPRMYSKDLGSKYICIEDYADGDSKSEWHVSVESYDNDNISELPKYFRDLDSAKSYAEEFVTASTHARGTKRTFTKYPSGYVKAYTTLAVSDSQMDDWRDICRALAKKVHGELLFVNETSCGIEFPDGSLRHIYIDEVADYL